MKRNLILLFCVATVAVYALSCATAPPVATPSPNKVTDENIVTVNASFEKVYDAFINYFADKGLDLESADKFTGNIVTKEIEITDEYLVAYYINTTGDENEWQKKGIRLGYCDCGLPPREQFEGLTKNLYYSYAIDIKNINGRSTQFRVKTKFWSEIYKMHAFYVITYEGDWECASSGEYEKKLIEEIETNYLKK